MNVERQLRTAAVEVLASRPVEFAHLFGSHARGEARDDSDVDVAVHLSAEVAPGTTCGVTRDRR